jgi:tRNA threonylcarbamoyladenosine biosynthesis protein TsaB
MSGASHPLILAVDTTSEFGSIALRSGGCMALERAIHSPDGFGHLLFGEIETTLQEAGVGLSEITCFAAAAGPGSFTGVRVGLTAAKGLAEVHAKPIAAISNLRALATFGTRERRAVILDARRGDVYAAVYDSKLECWSEEVVMKLPAWLETLSDESYEFITVTGSPFRTSLAGTRFAEMAWTESPRAMAGAVGLCAELDLAAGRPLDPLTADANYVRRSDAELLWRDRSSSASTRSVGNLGNADG